MIKELKPLLKSDQNPKSDQRETNKIWECNCDDWTDGVGDCPFHGVHNKYRKWE